MKRNGASNSSWGYQQWKDTMSLTFVTYKLRLWNYYTAKGRVSGALPIVITRGDLTDDLANRGTQAKDGR